MIQIEALIGELKDTAEKFGNTCVYIAGLSWGAVALNYQAEDQKHYGCPDCVKGKVDSANCPTCHGTNHRTLFNDRAQLSTPEPSAVTGDEARAAYTTILLQFRRLDGGHHDRTCDICRGARQASAPFPPPNQARDTVKKLFECEYDLELQKAWRLINRIARWLEIIQRKPAAKRGWKVTERMDCRAAST